MILSQATISTFTLSWNGGEPSDVIVETILLSFSTEISMIKPDSLVDLMVAGLLQISWVRLFSIVHGLNVLFFSGYILQVKCVGNDCEFDLGDLSSPVTN